MRRLPLLAVLLGLMLLLGGTAASADPPSRIVDPVTDDAGVLAPGDGARIAEAFDRLRDAEGTQLFVIYVGSFDGADGQAWADAAAGLSQFGDDDVLLAVAVEDRAYGLSVAEGFAESDATVDAAAAAAEARLAEGDWAGAAIAAAERLGGGGGVPVGAVLLGGVALVGGGAYLVARRRRARPPGPVTPAPPRDEFTDVPTDDLAYRSSTGLIEVDDAVRTSEVELSAARGHFGDATVAGFTAAVEASRADMLRAFAIRQQLDDAAPDDAAPDDDATRRALSAEIIRVCRAADARLDAQVEAFDRLRDLEANAPRYLGGLATRRGAVGPRARTRLAEAQRHLQLATSGGDPTVALREVRQADALGQEALRLAQSDVSGWSAPASGGSGLGVDLGSLILGGIISGAARGGFGGAGSGGGGFGGRSPGSFGGSSSRGRRGGGGRF